MHSLREANHSPLQIENGSMVMVYRIAYVCMWVRFVCVCVGVCVCATV